jgi:CRISPR system Cascade subunit CasA
VNVAYNLIDERWIPVERRSGKIEMIAPAEIADRDDPPLRVASPRPDFDGALLEFLVGLVQTAAAPRTERAWEGEFEAPPPPQTLKKRFNTVREAFHVDGDGPRFMQDLTVAKDSKASTEPIGAMLVDRIGESGLSESPSLFAKPGLVHEIGFPAAAAALMTLQTYAPPGGRGQLTSLRGGGPLTTLVLGQTLWETVWLNVLPRPEFEGRVPGDPSKAAVEAVFPWMGKTRTSATKGGVLTPPQKVHPLQHLWGLPRRIRLVIEKGSSGVCRVSGAENVPVVRNYVGRPDGTSYDGDYRHPWTPYSLGKPNEPWNPKKGGADGLPYRDWPLLVTGNEKRRPAIVVSYFGSSGRRELVAQPRLVAFGYGMDNMKPLRWCRAETPLVTVPPQLAGSFAADVDAVVAVSEEVRKTFSFQVKAAWSDRPADLDVFSRVNPAFWSATEPAFFATVQALKRGLEAGDSTARDAAREAWLEELHRAALILFDSFIEVSAELAAPDLRRAVVARRNLEQFTRPSSSKLRKLLNLTVEESAKPNKPKGRNHRKELKP